jgi:hypothetical protein
VDHPVSKGMILERPLLLACCVEHLSELEDRINAKPMQELSRRGRIRLVPQRPHHAAVSMLLEMALAINDTIK